MEKGAKMLNTEYRMFNTMQEFLAYFNSFYGTNGIYSMGRDATLTEVSLAAEQLANKHGEFTGDSVDREWVRDIVFTTEELENGYRRANHG